MRLPLARQNLRLRKNSAKADASNSGGDFSAAKRSKNTKNKKT
jgi:hypothetical protein